MTLSQKTLSLLTKTRTVDFHMILLKRMVIVWYQVQVLPEFLASQYRRLMNTIPLLLAASKYPFQKWMNIVLIQQRFANENSIWPIRIGKIMSFFLQDFIIMYDFTSIKVIPEYNSHSLVLNSMRNETVSLNYLFPFNFVLWNGQVTPAVRSCTRHELNLNLFL